MLFLDLKKARMIKITTRQIPPPDKKNSSKISYPPTGGISPLLLHATWKTLMIGLIRTS